MENLIIIPARLESSRLPNKPLAKIANLPMIIHVMNRAIESKCGDVIVATPNQEIFDTISLHNGTAIMTKFSHESGSDRIFEALEKYDKNSKYKSIKNEFYCNTHSKSIFKKVKNQYEIKALKRKAVNAISSDDLKYKLDHKK